MLKEITVPPDHIASRSTSPSAVGSRSKQICPLKGVPTLAGRPRTDVRQVERDLKDCSDQALTFLKYCEWSALLSPHSEAYGISIPEYFLSSRLDFLHFVAKKARTASSILLGRESIGISRLFNKAHQNSQLCFLLVSTRYPSALHPWKAARREFVQYLAAGGSTGPEG